MNTIKDYFDKYASDYNRRHGTSHSYGGSINVTQYDNSYYVKIRLVVHNYINEIIYDYSKDFIVYKNQHNKTIYMDKYTFTNIVDDLDQIVKIQDT